MKYISTRGKVDPANASLAIQQGLAKDGGLYVPEHWPHFEMNDSPKALGFVDFSARVMAPFFEGDALATSLAQICREAFTFDLPLRQLDAKTSVLELFHGPTCAFKDFGARFLALCSERIPAASNKQKLVMVATSGDTGGAVAAAFCSCTTTPVVILFPKGMVSARQEKQLTSWGQQVQAFAVRGSFDDCQRMVKEAFLSSAWQSRFELLSANSINLGRLLPQMAYFAYASLQSFVRTGRAPSFIIPSGNMGNSAAALWAKKIGFPIEKVIFAHNANKSVLNYFSTGQWQPLPTVATLANAMDVGRPSNFERVLHLYPHLKDLQNVSSAVSVSDAEIRKTIAEDVKLGHIWCPHTATAAFARRSYQQGNFILVATAHPAKFETIVEPLIGKSVEIPEQMLEILAQPSLSKEIEAQLSELESSLAV